MLYGVTSGCVCVCAHEANFGIHHYPILGKVYYQYRQMINNFCKNTLLYLFTSTKARPISLPHTLYSIYIDNNLLCVCVYM